VTTAGALHQAWHDLPFGRLDDIIGGGCCLVLAPHPDDESLGCGGLIAACCAAGRPPLVAILTDGSQSHPGSRIYPPAALAALREREARRAIGILGLPPARLILLRQPDGAAPHGGPVFDFLTERLARLAEHAGCSAVVAPWRCDPHCDHGAAFRLGARIAEVAATGFVTYPVWGWVLSDDAVVDTYVEGGFRLDISPHRDAKRRAVAAHASQYAGLITDDPAGFRLPLDLLRAADRPWETFLAP